MVSNNTTPERPGLLARISGSIIPPRAERIASRQEDIAEYREMLAAINATNGPKSYNDLRDKATREFGPRDPNMSQQEIRDYTVRRIEARITKLENDIEKLEGTRRSVPGPAASTKVPDTRATDTRAPETDARRSNLPGPLGWASTGLGAMRRSIDRGVDNAFGRGRDRDDAGDDRHMSRSERITARRIDTLEKQIDRYEAAQDEIRRTGAYGKYTREFRITDADRASGKTDADIMISKMDEAIEKRQASLAKLRGESPAESSPAQNFPETSRRDFSTAAVGHGDPVELIRYAQNGGPITKEQGAQIEKTIAQYVPEAERAEFSLNGKLAARELRLYGDKAIAGIENERAAPLQIIRLVREAQEDLSSVDPSEAKQIEDAMKDYGVKGFVANGLLTPEEADIQGEELIQKIQERHQIKISYNDTSAHMTRDGQRISGQEGYFRDRTTELARTDLAQELDTRFNPDGVALKSGMSPS